MKRYNGDFPVAAIYCRLSKEDLDKDTLKKGAEAESESIQNQKLLLVDYAIQNGFIIHKVYVDEDYSGFSDRPEFKQMIRDAEMGLFNTIICKHQSRFTRDMELVEKYIHGLFVQWGVRFISFTDNIDTNVKGNKKARQINGLINEWYSEDLSENIRTVLRRKMNDGQFIGSFACYGYERNPLDKHKLIVDEEAATVIRQIFNLYLEGCGVKRIANILTENGIQTPSQYKKGKGLKFANPNGGVYSEKYGLWSLNTIKRILKNETYIGTLIQGREKKVSYKSKKIIIAPRDEWVVIKNNHEPIVSEKDYYTVQRLIGNKRTDYGFKEGECATAKAHVMAGKLHCSDCDAAMQRSGASRDGKTRYLRCAVSAKSNGRECSAHGISQQRLEDIVKSKIQTLIDGIMKASRDEVVGDVLNQIAAVEGSKDVIQKQHTDIETKIQAIQKKILAAYSDKLDGVISEADYLSFKEAFEEEKRTLNNRKERLAKDLEECERQLQTQSALNTLVEKYTCIDVLTHETVNNFIKSIQIGEKDTITNEQEVIINWLF